MISKKKRKRNRPLHLIIKVDQNIYLFQRHVLPVSFLSQNSQFGNSRGETQMLSDHNYENLTNKGADLL